jgi:flagellar biosynthesis/type III secretory pathway protein FliH
VLEASEGELVKLALAIAERVIGLELTTNPEQLVSWAKEAIATLPAREQLVVALSSDLADVLPKSAWVNVTNDRHTLEVDHRLPPGTCEVRTSATSVEVSAAARLEAVSETIGAIS